MERELFWEIPLSMLAYFKKGRELFQRKSMFFNYLNTNRNARTVSYGSLGTLNIEKYCLSEEIATVKIV